MRRLPVVLAALALVPAAQATAPPLQNALNAAVEAGVPAALALSERPGRPTLRLAAGWANRATGSPMKPGLRFRVGSVTKTFVAALVLQLADEQRLALDDTVEHWLPGLVPNGDGITIRQLLRHQSGLFDYTNDQRIFKPYLAGRLGYRWTPHTLVEIAVSHPPLFDPGTDWQYSNTNYVVLGLIAERAGRAPLGQLLARRIFRPLGLASTTFSAGTSFPGPRMHGYYGGTDVTGLSASWAWAAGAIASTANDLARFYRALFSGRLLSTPLLTKMEQTVPIGNGDNRYGLGLIRIRTPCGFAWGHDGLVPGYRTLALASRDGKKVAVVAEAISARFPSGPQDQTFDELAATAYCG